MIPVKFRGRSLATGEFVYGYFCRLKSGDFIMDEDGKMTEIELDSYQQHVGIDVYGDPVYDGDILVDEKGREYTATFCIGDACMNDEFEWEDDEFPDFHAIYELKLKKEADPNAKPAEPVLC